MVPETCLRRALTLYLVYIFVLHPLILGRVLLFIFLFIYARVIVLLIFG